MSMSGFSMAFPIIRVRDKTDGKTHIVGTGSHDCLYIGDDGQIHYRNYQNGEATGDHGDYEFVGCEDDMEPWTEIGFVGIDTLLDIYSEQMRLSADRERKMREAFAKWLEVYKAEQDISDKEGFWHS